ncbi:HNH endonuclease [Promicromonospora sp. NPDC019610]|uniref:HNH endonuclease n=1 Tax=Promicromonospora sp. NPDC019610 TaxID=3364405 RepID=UPI00378EB55F
MSAESTYLMCASAATEPTRATLTSLTPNAVQAASNYAAAATTGALASLDPIDFSIADDVDVQLRENYSHRMAQKGSPARDVYDQIKVLSDFCVLCGAQLVTELDHYLPKKHFPLLAVAPENLLPVCHPCNHRKAQYRPDDTRAALPNPYFDKFLDEPWLAANVAQSTRSIDFAVSPPASWPPERTERLRAHFKQLGLRQTFSTFAASEVATIEGLMAAHPRAKRAKLLESLVAGTERRMGLNHWKSATLRALVASDWYLTQGYQQMS